ncbi:TolC family outer membrane protein [Brevundimonas sp. FT23028]|uniref:TolC family outer membrane protein n=1 Tax=Brevundimonas sp. FT23028 TaxID=3393748 RepID=UPI003B58955E
MLKRSRALTSVAVIAMVAGIGAPAWADTLQEAIALAYRTNPSLLAQRANQRALDESIVQARAGLRPTLDVTLSGSYTRTDSPVVGTPPFTSGGVSETDSASATIGVGQNLWTGGRVGHAITAADAEILSGRENLRDIEQSVLALVIQAYADVIRDTEVLRIREANLGVLRRQLDESTARFEVGEITRTDVAQSEARLAQSEADLANARAQLSVSRAAYAAVVGQAPGDLAPMPTLPGVPSDFDAALDEALLDNPGIRAAAYSLQAAEANVAAAKAEFLPSLRATASYGGSSEFDRLGDLGDNTRLTAGATLSVPLFTGGLNSSRVAQALERANAAQIGVEGERRNTLQAVSSAYAQSISARATLQAGQEAVRAATVAAEGVRQEAQVGLRTTLDVLNQELELRNAEVTLAGARRNEYVAQANLLAAMGKLEGPDLVPDIETYDPAANYRRVRNRGALPWDAVVETIDRVAAPAIVPAADAEDAPVDAQLKSEVVRTAPRD